MWGRWGLSGGGEMMVKKKQVDLLSFSDVYKGSLESDGQLTEYVNQTMIIKDVEFTELGTYGEVAIAIVEVDGETKRLHTFSQVLIKQLKAIKPYLEQGKPIRATLRKRKRYYTFE